MGAAPASTAIAYWRYTLSAHNVIVLTAAPAGRFLEGTLSGVATPGMLMQVKAGVALDGSGRLTWEKFNGAADGERTLIAILREDLMTGRKKTDAYADGDRIYLYCPIPGDELQVLVKNETGTAESFQVGDKLIADDGTGLFVPTTGTPESEPFIVCEEIEAITADTHCHCLFTGY